MRTLLFVAENFARVAVKLRGSVNGSMIGGRGVGQRVRVAFDGGCKYGFRLARVPRVWIRVR